MLSKLSCFEYTSGKHRVRSLDFLRGMAIILVLFRHHAFFQPLRNAGWIGVDLFFVLSGYLIAQLLFEEYKRNNSINIGRFLIRRGFKIYPVFYLAILLTVILELIKGSPPQSYDILSEIFFLQNYLGNYWSHTWSLAVEEHFYIVLPLFLSVLIRYKGMEKRNLWLVVSLILFISVFILRLINAETTYSHKTHLFPTHLRIDSLFGGVLMAYWYCFYRDDFNIFFKKWSRTLLFFSIPILLSTTFIRLETVFMHTAGLSLLIFSFVSILGFFLSNESIEEKLNKLFGKRWVNAISNIGISSYACYVFHMFVIKYFLPIFDFIGFNWPIRIDFVIYFFTSLWIGWMVTKYLDRPILSFRNRSFPRV